MQYAGRHEGSPIALRRCGFTLVELLVVIGIIVVLMSILLPALNKVRQAAQTTVCLSNLRQMGVAMAMYTNDWKVYPWRGPAIGGTIPYTTTFQYSDQLSAYTKTLGWEPDNWYLGKTYQGMYTIPRSKMLKTLFICPADPVNSLPDGAGGAAERLTSYSYNIGLVAFNSSQSVWGWMVGGQPAVGGMRMPVGSLRNTHNLALLVCGGGMKNGFRRAMFCDAIKLPTGAVVGTRADDAGDTHGGGSTMLFCDGHAARISVDRGSKLRPDDPSPGYVFDRSIQVNPNDRYYTLPRP